jgi:DNA polymerase I-like protein with 3'-5' exonuclease and polymerase domains
VGLFDGIELATKKQAHIHALPPVPDTGWKPPTEFPNLSNAVLIAFDTETKDPELGTAGPGWARGKGHIIGYSLAAQDRQGNIGRWYFPMRHEVEGHDNLDVNNCLAYAQHVLGNPNVAKVGANVMYDIGWFAEEGVTVNGPFHDIQFAEAIIDNNADGVALETLAVKYLGEHKRTDHVKDWIMAAYKPAKSKWRGELYRTPPRLVGYYGEGDADQPLRIIQRQWPIIAAENLGQIYDLEHDLIPLLIAMRQAGVRVDTSKAYQFRAELEDDIRDLYAKIEHEYGYRLVNTKGDESSDSRQIGKLLDHLGIQYPQTKAGNPSIQKEWLEVLKHPVADDLLAIREHEKILGTFVDSYVLNKNVNGFLYPIFHPLKGETNGTFLGRFASSDPNLQNIPSRTELGKRVRKLFVPDEGHSHWQKNDYSQIHYRILAHYAVDDPRGPYGGAEALRQSYINDPNMDYHRKVYNEVAPLMGWSTTDEEVIAVKRRPIKNVNFSLLYGVGKDTMVYKYLKGMTDAEVEAFFEAYYTGAPYVKPTMKAIADEAEQFGYIETLRGRRIRFNLWEPRSTPKGSDRNNYPALRYADAISRYGSYIRLAFLYRAVNYKFQGSEPDIMKSGMVACWKSGVFDYTGVPRLTVHDELDFSVPDNSPRMQEAFAFIKHTMETTTTMRVPIKVDATTGDTWGDCA